jgi:hypothetical protein
MPPQLAWVALLMGPHGASRLSPPEFASRNRPNPWSSFADTPPSRLWSEGRTARRRLHRGRKRLPRLFAESTGLLAEWH